MAEPLSQTARIIKAIDALRCAQNAIGICSKNSKEELVAAVLDGAWRDIANALREVEI